MLSEWTAVLAAAAAAAAGRQGPPDAALLDAWLAVWALGQAGHGSIGALATGLAARPLGPGEALTGGLAGPPEPAIQAAASLALQAASLDGAKLAPLRGALANAVNAAWRPAGRFAFSRNAVPVPPSPFDEALAVTAWARLPDPVPERRLSRARRVMTGMARLAAEGGEATALPALWAAAGLVRAAEEAAAGAAADDGLASAGPVLLAAVEARLRAPPPDDATGIALLGLALATAAAALQPIDRDRARHCARAASRHLASDGLAAPATRAAALALAAFALLPADDGPAASHGMPLRPALRQP